MKKAVILLLSIILLLAGCGKSQTNAEKVWEYCSDKGEFKFNETFVTSDNDIIVVTEDFIAVCSVDGNRIKSNKIIDMSDGFEQYEDGYDEYAASLRADMSSDDKLLLWTNTELSIFDTEKYEFIKFKLETSPADIRGWIGNDGLLVLSNGGETVTSDDITLTTKGRPIASKDVVAVAENRLYIKSSNGGIYSIVFRQDGEQVVNYDKITSQPAYNDGRYAVFSQTDGKYMLDLKTGKLTEFGTLISERVRASNIFYVSDDHIILTVKSGSKVTYTAYCISKDEQFELARTTPVRFGSGFAGTLVMLDVNYKSYWTTGTQCDVAQSTEGVPTEKIYYMIELNAGVRYSVWGYNERGNVYEYTLDLLA